MNEISEAKQQNVHAIVVTVMSVDAVIVVVDIEDEWHSCGHT